MIKREIVCFNRQPRARSEPYQIVCVRQRARLIEIVDAPDQSTLAVTPGAVILNVQISNPQDLWRASEFGTQRGEQLRPAIKRGAQKRKTVLRHQPVFRPQVRSDDSNLAREPCLILTRCANNAMCRIHYNSPLKNGIIAMDLRGSDLLRPLISFCNCGAETERGRIPLRQ